jgi:hypothetical protein
MYLVALRGCHGLRVVHLCVQGVKLFRRQVSGGSNESSSPASLRRCSVCEKVSSARNIERTALGSVERVDFNSFSRLSFSYSSPATIWVSSAVSTDMVNRNEAPDAGLEELLSVLCDDRYYGFL